MLDPTAASYFQGKRVFVTGGTGSFGHQITEALLGYSVAELTIFSRDEAKQHAMQLRFGADSRVRFVVGDVRDAEHVRLSMEGADIVYHAAALKQVPACEFHPLEAVLTNVMGAENVRRAAIANRVGVLVAISTDKAVKPVNAMGMSKALQEKLILSPGSRNGVTRMVCVRYGNVVASRGSVIPHFLELAQRGAPLLVTDPTMTRFLLTLREAIDLVIQATMAASSRALWVKKMPAATVLDIARAVGIVVHNNADYPVQIVGPRPGEKVHEVLVSEEEMRRARELPDHFVVFAHDVEPSGPGTVCDNHGEYSSDYTMRLGAVEVVPLIEPIFRGRGQPVLSV